MSAVYESKRIILASASPRRRELLAQLLPGGFEVIPAQGEENAPEGLTPNRLVAFLAAQKAGEILQSHPEALIIGADTVVDVDGTVLGKPKNKEYAAEMLGMLSGREHLVHTGIAVLYGEKRISDSVTTTVRFRKMTGDEIRAYIATGEPMDKAGAYGIQGLGSLFVSGLVGDYYNVMGLPLYRLGMALNEMGVNLL